MSLPEIGYGNLCDTLKGYRMHIVQLKLMQLDGVCDIFVSLKLTVCFIEAHLLEI